MTKESTNHLLQNYLSKHERFKLNGFKELPLKNYDSSVASTNEIVNLYEDTLDHEATRKGFKSSEFKT